MKKILAVACAALIFATNVANAEDYNEIGLGYNLDMYKSSLKGADPINASGFSVKYIHGFGVSSSLPMYVETGLNLAFGFGSNDDDSYFEADGLGWVSQKSQFANLSIPVNFAYKFGISDNFSIKPYLGLNLKLNVLGRQKSKLSDDFYNDMTDYLIDEEGYTETQASELTNEIAEEFEEEMGDWTNLYSTSDRHGMGSKDAAWNRFQLGWHIGVDLEFNKFFIGLNYGTDFIHAWKLKKNHVSSSTFNIGIGFVF